MTYDTVGEADLRAEDFDSIVKAIALQEFKMKGVVMNSSSNAWAETYYAEAADELTAGTNLTIKGVPRLAGFPYAEPSWEKKTAYIEKYGCETIISYEDEISSNIPVIARSLLRVGRAVANAVDTQIYTALSGASGINTQATNAQWDNAVISSRDPISDIMNAKRELYIDNFDPDGNEASLLLSPPRS